MKSEKDFDNAVLGFTKEVGLKWDWKESPAEAIFDEVKLSSLLKALKEELVLRDEVITALPLDLLY